MITKNIEYQELKYLIKFFQKNVGCIKKCRIFAPQFQIGICSCSKADFLEQRAQCQACLSNAESRQKAEGIKRVSKRTFWSSERNAKLV